MKKISKKLGIFVVILLLLSFLADFIITSGLRKTNIRMLSVWNDIYASTIKSDVLIMGSSETWCGYNTFFLDSLLHCDSYNIAMDGHSMRYQLIRYNTFCRYCQPPKALIINLDFPGTFGYDDNPYEREQFFPYILDRTLIEEVSHDMKITLFDRYLPLYRYFGYRELFENGICAYFGKKSFEDDGMYKGFRGNDYKWSSGSLHLDETFEAPLDSIEISLFDNFVLERKKEGLKVVLVAFPEYYLLRNKFSNLLEVEKTFDSIAERLQVPLLDYSQSEICCDSTYYYNPSHLNKHGAEVFTTILCQDLDSLESIGLW